MAELLNYRASHSAVYYKPVKLILPGRFVAGLSAACVLTIIVAMAYAVVLPELQSFLLRIGASLTFSVMVGVIGGMAVRYGKLRIPVAAGFVGLLLSLLAFYSSWLFWVHHIVSQLRFQLSLQFLILNPISFFRLVRLIEMSGAWTYNHNAVSGVPLLIC
jgi:hypothetical protein